MSRLLVCHHLIKEIILTRRIVLMPERTCAPAFIDGLYGKLVEGGINYFFPSANLQAIETGLEPAACGMTNSSDQTSLDLCWLGSRYALTRNRSEEHTSELQSRSDLVCRLLLEKKQ